VRDASFAVKKGAVTGFLGRNGAGKSTTLNIITGYISPSGGKVLFDGLDLLDEPREIKRRIGYLPEQPPLYSDMTVREYLRFVCRLKEVAPHRIPSHLDDLYAMTRLQDHRKRLIRNLSKGYRQRVGLAQALVGDPDVIILDEPIVGLDPRQIIEFRGLIRDLGARHTVLLSSHILREVADVCGRVVIINEGRIVAQDALANLAGRGGDALRVQLRAAGPEKEIGALIGAQRGVRSAACLGEKEPGTVDFLLDCEPGEDVRGRVAARIVEAGYPLLMLRPLETDLEEIFLRMTGGAEGGEGAC